MPVTVVQGGAADLPFQCMTRSNANAVFEAGDILSVAIIAHGSTTPLGSPYIAFYAADNQTGYDQGQVMISLASSDTSGLSAATQYTLAAQRQLAVGGRTEYIVRQQLVIETPAI